jgi:flavin-dependent dehydrogenase
VRVLLLDRRTFPRHKACACGLTRKTLKALRYAVDPVVERVCHEIVLEPASSLTRLRLRDRRPIAAMAVRERFDGFCLEQTMRAGKRGGSVALRKIESVVALREAGDGVELEVETADGRETLRAAVVIGADGSNGQTRRLAGVLDPSGGACGRESRAASRPAEPAWYRRGFALEATVPYGALPATLPEGDEPRELLFDFSPLPGGYGWLFPKGDHVNIGVGAFAPAAGGAAEPELNAVTRALLAAYTQRKLGVALDAATMQVSGQHLGMGGHGYVPRGRVLLVGDAAGLVDALTGEGIHSAVVSGQAAAAAIVAARGVGYGGVARLYGERLRPLQQTLAFSERAARAFYREPARGFKVMRTPLVGRLALKTYTDGLPIRWLRPLVRMAARR